MSAIADHREQPDASDAPTEPLLEVRDLKVHFPIRGAFGGLRSTVRAVDGLDFELFPGETLGLVGESGCGKSTPARAILRLVKPTGGHVFHGGRDLALLSERDMREERRDLQMIFQDPYASLDPRMTIGSIVSEPLWNYGMGSRSERRDKVRELLEAVGLSADMADRYPHEFSGGQRQRIGVARALALEPRIIFCDEAVSALDVSIQAQILNLLVRLQQERSLTYLFIAHDLAVVRHISDRVAVMYLGRIVEIADHRAIYQDPRHPYTRALLSAIPIPDPAKERARQRIHLEGDVPSPDQEREGCRFASRCPIAEDRCLQEEPELVSHGARHQVACWKA